VPGAVRHGSPRVPPPGDPAALKRLAEREIEALRARIEERLDAQDEKEQADALVGLTAYFDHTTRLYQRYAREFRRDYDKHHRELLRVRAEEAAEPEPAPQPPGGHRVVRDSAPEGYFDATSSEMRARVRKMGAESEAKAAGAAAAGESPAVEGNAAGQETAPAAAAMSSDGPPRKTLSPNIAGRTSLADHLKAPLNRRQRRALDKQRRNADRKAS
jgi:hypothetical protein